MKLTVEEQNELEAEISRLSSIQDSTKQQYEFLKFFHDNCLWKKAAEDVFNSYVVGVKTI